MTVVIGIAIVVIVVVVIAGGEAGVVDGEVVRQS
jgi:hypothetical protein